MNPRIAKKILFCVSTLCADRDKIVRAKLCLVHHKQGYFVDPYALTWDAAFVVFETRSRKQKEFARHG